MESSNLFKMRYLLIFTLIIVSVYLSFIPANDGTEGFKKENITKPLKHNPLYEIEPQSEEVISQVKQILKAPLTYLCKGGQVYIFESYDKKWVVKFMKYHLINPSLKNYLLAPIPYIGEPIKELVLRRSKKFDQLNLGYIHGYNLYPDKAAILYLHFNPTENYFGSQSLIDKAGNSHWVDLDKTAFIVQKKGIPLNEVIGPLLKQKNYSAASKKINQIFDLYRSQYALGLHDKDYGVMKNFGFQEESPFHLDLGKLVLDKEMSEKNKGEEDLVKVKKRLIHWVKKHYPHTLNQLEIR